MIGRLNARRGTTIDSEVRKDKSTAVVDVSLNDMFGYSSQLRGAIQDKGEFSMEYKVISAWSGVECGAARLIYDEEQHASVPKCVG